MRLVKSALCGAMALACACGGAARPVDPPSAEAALARYRAGDLEGALALADGGDVLSREIAARSALARGDTERALRATEARREEPLVRLRAAALSARDRHAAAAALLASLDDGADDPWASALAAIGAASEGRTLFEREGTSSAELPLDVELALPVVRVRVETREVRALVATSVHFTVLSPALRAEAAGVADELALGSLRVRAVPFVSRELDVISEALGAPIDAVLGVDLLARVGATLDGPGQRLVVGEPAAGERTESARFEGTFLAARVQLGQRASWLALDSTGAFAVALSPLGAERLALRASPCDLALTPAVRVEGVPLTDGVLDDALEEASGAPIDGAIGWALLSQLVLTLDGDAVRLALPR